MNIIVGKSLSNATRIHLDETQSLSRQKQFKTLMVKVK